MRIEIHHRGKLIHSFESVHDIKSEMVEVFCIYPSKINLMEDVVDDLPKGVEIEEVKDEPPPKHKRKNIQDILFLQRNPQIERPKARYSNKYHWEK